MVIHSSTLSILSQIIGWIYFLLWSLSFYPQAWENWKRKRCVSLCPGNVYTFYNLHNFLIKPSIFFTLRKG